jgi:hypothetical protein
VIASENTCAAFVLNFAVEADTEVEEEFQIEEGPSKVVEEELALDVAAKVRQGLEQHACGAGSVLTWLIDKEGYRKRDMPSV